MDLTRRQAVLAGIGLMAAGCSATPASRSARPTPWSVNSYREFQRPTPTGQAQVVTPAPALPTSPAIATPNLQVIARSSWTRTAANGGKVNPMNGVSRITVHHEGWKTVYFTDERTTAQRIETIRAVHTRDNGWGDIGYHYIVDRDGRIWEGRSIASQGAHVRNNNENNLGILLLGNFDKQTPSAPQMASLHNALAAFQKQYKVRATRIHTHQELASTACPGTNLQNQMAGVRQRLA